MCDPLMLLKFKPARRIFLFYRNDPADISRGIIHVSFVPRDQMNMDMWDGLTCHEATVYADVVSVRSEPVAQQLFGLPQQASKWHQLFLGRIKKSAKWHLGIINK